MNLDISDINHFDKLDLLAKQAVEGFITGLHKSPYHGFSIEFSEHKLYNQGESTRHIDWKVFAKSDRLYTKRFEEETNLRCHLILDTSNSMYYPEHPKTTKLNFSIFAAACLSYLCQKQRDGFGLTFFTDKISYQSEIKSSASHLHLILKELNKLSNISKPATSNTNISQTLEYLAQSVHRRSLIVLFSDLFDAANEMQNNLLFNALLHLKHNKHEIIIFNISDKNTELDFNFDNTPYRFVDSESGEIMKIIPSQVKEQYTHHATAFLNEIKFKCEQFKITFVDVDINEGWDKIMLSFLVKRAKMK